MDKYLKMADVFMGVVYPMQISGWKHQDRYVELKKIQVAAAHAINSHDELVAEVERLRYENSILRTRLENSERLNNELLSEQ